MKRSEKFSEIRAIADDVCSNSATAEQLQQLEQQLSGNAEAKRFYFDYLSVHNRIKSSADRNSEVVYRRMIEEVVIRPQGNEELYPSATISAPNAQADQVKHPQSKSKWLYIILVLLGLAVVLFWWLLGKVEPELSPQIALGKLNIVGKDHIAGKPIFSDEYQIAADSVLTLDNGDSLALSKGSKIKIFTDTEFKLKAGTLKITSISGNNIFVHGDNFRLSSYGDSLALDLTHKQAIVTSGQNTVLHAERWRPKHYWSFDGDTDRVVNSTSSAYGVLASGVSRVKGLLGPGAFDFDNSANARIDLGSGGGTAPATGSFSVTDGLTIEALIAPRYTGKAGEVDEIFRKGHLDGELKVSLGIHYSRGQRDLQPINAPLASISFGLYLVGQGYHELKLPLDGKEGRPTLAQLTSGQAYHLVASYDVKSGLKAIYINGNALASYPYPAGSKMLSGGPGGAAIGNNPTKEYWQKFAFSGVIDELAFYDFALPAFMVKQHHAHMALGVNYFGLAPSAKVLPEQVKIILPANTSISLEPITGLPARMLKD